MDSVTHCITSNVPKNPSQIVFLIDNSTTATTDAILLDHLRVILLTLERSPNDVYFSVVVMGTTTQVVTAFTKDKDQVKRDLGADITILKAINLGTEPNISAALNFCQSSVVKPKISPQQGNPIIMLLSSCLPPATDTGILNAVAGLSTHSISLVVLNNNPAVNSPALSTAIGNSKTLSKVDIPDIPKLLFPEFFTDINGQTESLFSIGVFLDPTCSAQTMDKDVKIRLSITPLKSTLAANHQIEILKNDFYESWGSKIDKPLERHQRTVVDCKLIVAYNHCEIPPPRIFFNILDPNNNVVFHGYFSLPTALYAGEFYDHPFTVLCDGIMGSGKTSAITNLINVFTIGDICHPFFTSKSTGSHGTETFKFNPVALYVKKNSKCTTLTKNIFERLELIIADKKGITAMDNKVLYNDCSEGRYHHNEFRRLDPNPNYVCDCFIFVAGVRSFLDAAHLAIIQNKLKELNDNKKKAILAVTMSDILDESELKTIKDVIKRIPIEEKNVIFTKNYINESTQRDPEKDYATLALLLHARNIAKSDSSSIDDETMDWFANRNNKREE